MAVKTNVSTLGPWAFILGIVIALLAGVFAPNDTAVVLLLTLLGLVVGLLNVEDKEAGQFLLASVAFIIAASGLQSVFSAFQIYSGLDIAGAVISSIVSYIIVFAAPAAGIVGLKVLIMVSKE